MKKNYKIRYFLATLLLKNNPQYDIICRGSSDSSIVFEQEKTTGHLQREKCKEKQIIKGIEKTMCKASEIGKIVVNKCLSKGIAINTQKLQKLLVLIQVECIRRSGFAFFPEDIRVWDCGVAIKEVDEDFRANGAGFNEEQIVNIVLLMSEENYIDAILDNYGKLPAFELNELPVNQRVISLGITREGDKVPHISAERLVEEFSVL